MLAEYKTYLVPAHIPGYAAMDTEAPLSHLVPVGITEARLKKPHLAHMYQVFREAVGVSILTCDHRGLQVHWQSCAVDVGFMFLQVVYNEEVAATDLSTRCIGHCILLCSAGSGCCHELEERFIAQAQMSTNVRAIKIEISQDHICRRLMGCSYRPDEPFKPTLLAFRPTGHQAGGLGGAVLLENLSMLGVFFSDIWKVDH